MKTADSIVIPTGIPRTVPVYATGPSVASTVQSSD
jgi:hypothetical protein